MYSISQSVLPATSRDKFSGVIDTAESSSAESKLVSVIFKSFFSLQFKEAVSHSFQHFYDNSFGSKIHKLKHFYGETQYVEDIYRGFLN